MQEFKLYDRAINEISDRLKKRLTWLDCAYGRATTERKTDRNTVKKYPVVYVGDGEYRSMLPHDGENYCFCTLSETQSVEMTDRLVATLRATVSVIFFYNIETIFTETDFRYTENIKDEILNILNHSYFDSGRFRVTRVHEGISKVFEGYSVNDIPEKLDMHPYASIRFEGELLVNQTC